MPQPSGCGGRQLPCQYLTMRRPSTAWQTYISAGRPVRARYVSITSRRKSSTASARTRFTVQPPKPRAGHARRYHTLQRARQLHHQVQLRRAHLVVVGQALVGRVEETAHLGQVASLAARLTVDSTRAFSLTTWRARRSRSSGRKRPLIERSRGVMSRRERGRRPRSSTKSSLDRPVALLPALVVGGGGQRPANAGVGDDDAQAVGLEVQRNGLGLQRAAVDA